MLPDVKDITWHAIHAPWHQRHDMTHSSCFLTSRTLHDTQFMLPDIKDMTWHTVNASWHYGHYMTHSSCFLTSRTLHDTHSCFLTSRTLHDTQFMLPAINIKLLMTSLSTHTVHASWRHGHDMLNCWQHLFLHMQFMLPHTCILCMHNRMSA